MTEFVRVRLENGAHASLPAGFAESHNLPVLKQDAVGLDGKALVDKPKTTGTASASGSKSTTPSSSDTAATKKETN